jgi:hypothetical protein
MLLANPVQHPVARMIVSPATVLIIGRYLEILVIA